MMDALKDKLKLKYEVLRELNDQPERCLSRFFLALRNEIVGQTEAMLREQLAGRAAPLTHQVPREEHRRVQAIRQYFFSGLGRMEAELVTRVKLGAVDWRPLHARLAELAARLERFEQTAAAQLDLDSVFVPQRVRDQGKYEFDALVALVEAETERVRRELFKSRTVFFAKTPASNGFGVLCVLDGFWLNEHEIGYLRTRLAETHSCPRLQASQIRPGRDLKPIFRFLNASMNRSRQIEFVDLAELSDHVLVLDKFPEHVAKCMAYWARRTGEPVYHVHVDASVLAQSEHHIDKPPSEVFYDSNQLDLAGNEIAKIQTGSFAHYTHLRRLDLSNNCLRTLPASALDQLAQLDELSLAGNGMAGLDRDAFAGLSKLRKLDLSSNALDEHILAGAIPSKHLKRLDLSHNRISVFRFTELARAGQSGCRLRRLDLSHNVIEQLDKSSFAGLEQLKRLDLSHNRIGVIAPKTFSLLSGRLEQLDLSANGIAEIRKHDLGALGSLKRLALSSNLIGRVEPGAFKRLGRLEDLRLDGNELDLIGADELFAASSKLLQLDLARNNITGLSGRSGLARLSGLKALRLSHNPLATVGADAFAGMRSLRSLHLDHCQLVSLDAASLQGLDKLSELHLNGNPLSSGAVEALGRAEELAKFKIVREGAATTADDDSELSNSKISEICSLGLFF